MERIAAGYQSTCAVMTSGELRCWGYNYNGQLGLPELHREEDLGDDEVPSSADPIDVGGRVVDVAIGRFHTCALLESGQVRCWGSSQGGKLGYGNDEPIGDDETPAQAGDVPLF